MRFKNLFRRRGAIHAGAQVDVHENKGNFVVAHGDIDRLFAGFGGNHIVTETLEQLRLDQRSADVIFNKQDGFLFLIFHGCVDSQLIFL